MPSGVPPAAPVYNATAYELPRDLLYLHLYLSATRVAVTPGSEELSKSRSTLAVSLVQRHRRDRWQTGRKFKHFNSSSSHKSGRKGHPSSLAPTRLLGHISSAIATSNRNHLDTLKLTGFTASRSECNVCSWTSSKC